MSTAAILKRMTQTAVLVLAAVVFSPPMTVAQVRTYPDQIIDSIVTAPAVDGLALELRGRANHRDRWEAKAQLRHSVGSNRYSDERSRNSVSVLLVLHLFDNAEIGQRYASTITDAARNSRRKLNLGDYSYIYSGPSNWVDGGQNSLLTINRGPWMVIVRVDAIRKSSLFSSAAREAWAIRAGEGMLTRLAAIVPGNGPATAIPDAAGKAGETISDALKDLAGGIGNKVGGIGDLVDTPVPFDPPETALVYVTAVAISVALIAGGIAASLAQTIAAAMANAFQAGIELTSEEINEAILRSLGMARDGSTGDAELSVRPPPAPPPPVPILNPKAGKPFETNDEGKYFAPNEYGNWQWMDASEAREAARALGMEKAAGEIDSDRFQQQTEERREELNRRAREQDDAQRREEAARRREEEERRTALDDIDRIREAAERMGLNEILERSHSGRTYDDDGSVDIDYVNRLKQALRNRLARDVAMSDDKLQQTSNIDILEDTLVGSYHTASESFLVRLGAGVATGGWSEAAFQGAGALETVWDNVNKAVDEGRDYTRGTALLDTAREFVRNNLPVNTADAFRKMSAGEKVSWTELGVGLVADAGAMLEVGNTAGASPGPALDEAAKRLVGAERLGNIKQQLGEFAETASAKIKSIDKAGTEAIDAALDRIGLKSRSGRLSPDLAEARFERGRLTAETESLVAETKASGATKAMDEAHASGRAAGRTKIEALERSMNELEAARAGGTATKAEIDALERELRDNVIRVQADKHALNELNKMPKTAGENAVIKTFNGEMDHIYHRADEGTIRRLADELGVRPEDIEVVNITNMKGQPALDIDPSAPPRDHYGHASHWEADGSVTHNLGEARLGGDVNTTGTGPWHAPPEAPAPHAPNGAKASFDRDLTLRVRTVDPVTGRVVMRDIPSTTTARVYNEELYKAAKGVDHAPTPSRPSGADALETMKKNQTSIDFKDTHLTPSEHLADPLDIADADKFAKRMDQATTDRLHPEAYGTGQADLDTATKDLFRGRDLTDAAGTAKTVEFKVNHWMKEAEQLERAAEAATSPSEKRRLLEAAVAHQEEGQRQLVKQYGNMVVNRTRAMQIMGRAPGAAIPHSLSEGINVLKNVQTGHMTSAQAKAVLGRMGTSTEQLAGQMSAYVEGLQKLRGATGKGSLPTPSMPHIAIQGWRDELQQDETATH